MFLKRIPFLTVADLLVIITLLIITFFLFFSLTLGWGKNKDKETAGNFMVQVDGKIVIEEDLSKNGIYEVTGPLGLTRLELYDRKIRILSSPCPDKLCQKMGSISKPGEQLVCLPNRVIVYISEKNGGSTAGNKEFDAYTW